MNRQNKVDSTKIWRYLRRISHVRFFLRRLQLALQREDPRVLLAQLLPRAREQLPVRPAAPPAPRGKIILPRRRHAHVADARRELQRARALARVGRGGSGVDEHQRLRVPAEARGQDVRQLAVAERHVRRVLCCRLALCRGLLLLRERVETVSQSAEALVDVPRLAQTLAGGVRLAQALGPGEVDEV
eukprot:31303-Pelagococcus_subviridis.AAC.6